MKGFNKYSTLITTNTSVTTEDKLYLYGLYKLITVGNCNILEPSIFNIIDNKKYHAWKACDNLDKTVAINAYIECAKKYVK